MRKILMLLVLSIFLLSACNTQSEDGTSITGEVIEILPQDDINIEDGPIEVDLTENNEAETDMSDVEEQPSESSTSNLLRIEGVEGDTISLRPDAYDPDGDVIQFSYTEPFDQNGEWETVEGDAGEYVVKVTASDGRLSTSEEVLVVVLPTNRAPIVICNQNIEVKEGELVELECDISDPEGSTVDVEFSGWMTGTEKQTGFEDAGEYDVVVTASDGERETVRNIQVTVQNVNRVPVVSQLDTIMIEETETAVVKVDAEDPDGDTLRFSFNEPFNSNGQWKTNYGDAGTYESYVTVSDGSSTSRVDFTLVVKLKNTAPNLDFIDSIIVDEGDTIVLPINAFDREGDELTVTISGFMTSERYTTTFEDAGEHTVTVTVDDGELSTSQDVSIIVNDVNRAPVFKILA